MLSKWDDYPVHQAPIPVAQTVGSDVGRYERYWFAGHDASLQTQIAFGLSVHPNRGIIDAAFSIMRNGRQKSVFASGPLSRDRDTQVGPIRLEIVEPMRILRIVVDDFEGISGDLTFTGVTQTIEDGRMRRESGHILVSDRIRTVQFGTWSGFFYTEGERVVCDPTEWWGFRDRSWGSRTTGTVAESAGAHDGSIYFAWTLLRFPDECLLVAVNEMPDGRSEARTAAVLPFIGPDEPAYGNDDAIVRGDVFNFDIAYQPGTRRAASVDLTVGPRGLIDRKILIVPVSQFQMQGLGYYHPVWRHGADHGGVAIGIESWVLADLDPAARENIHVQQLCRAVREDGSVGFGLFEHVAIGRHLPSGLPEGIAPLA